MAADGQFGGNFRREALRPAIRDGRNLDIRQEQDFVAAQDFLRHFDRGAPKLGDTRLDTQKIVHEGGFAIIDTDPPNGEGKRRIAGEKRRLVDPAGTKKFRAATFEKAQICDVLNDTGKVRVFVINTNWQVTRHGIFRHRFATGTGTAFFCAGGNIC
jgi:hypothetical protein